MFLTNLVQRVLCRKTAEVVSAQVMPHRDETIFWLAQAINENESAEKISLYLLAVTVHPDSSPNAHEVMYIAALSRFIVEQRHGMPAAFKTAKKIFDRASPSTGLRWIMAQAQHDIIEKSARGAIPLGEVRDAKLDLLHATDADILKASEPPAYVDSEKNMPQKPDIIPVREGKNRMTSYAFIKQYDYALNAS